MSDLRDELLEAFREEYREHLVGLRSALSAAEVSGADLEEALRRAHSLKAAARVCDLDVLAALSQGLETILSRAHRGDLPFGPEPASVVRQAADAIEAWASAWEAGQTPPEPIEALEAMDRLLGERRSSGVPPEISASRPHSTEATGGTPVLLRL